MKKCTSLSAVLALGVSAAMLVQSATAATNNTWNNGTTDWNLGTNWSLGTKAGSGNIAIFSSVSGDQTINLNGNQTVSGLSFTHVGNTTLASGNFTTSTVSIGADGIAVSAGGAVAPTIGVNMSLSANQTWTVGGVNQLVVATGKTVTNNGFNITIAGASTVAVTGTISGAGGLVKNGTNVLSLYGANSFSGGVTVNSGIARLNTNTALGNGTLTLAGGSIGTVNTTAITASNAVSVTGDFSYSSGPGLAALTLTGAVNLNGGTRTITQGETVTGSPGGHIINGVISNGGLVKAGTGVLTLGGVNTYTGNTTVNAGTLILADNSQSAFTIGANGTNSQFNGTGILTLDGDFSFDLTNAGTTLGNSWTIVNVGTLTETFGATFSVVGFSDVGGNIWEITNVNGGRTYQFSEGTGILSVTAVPEPATWVLLAAGLSVTMFLRRHRGA